MIGAATCWVRALPLLFFLVLRLLFGALQALLGNRVTFTPRRTAFKSAGKIGKASVRIFAGAQALLHRARTRGVSDDWNRALEESRTIHHPTAAAASVVEWQRNGRAAAGGRSYRASGSWQSFLRRLLLRLLHLWDRNL